jgi:hypothetical protein
LPITAKHLSFGHWRGERRTAAWHHGQTLRDWVVRYNADGIDGLYDHPKEHNTEKLSDSEQAVLLAKFFRRPILTVTEHEPGRSLISVICRGPFW